jgi:hypothetical protein
MAEMGILDPIDGQKQQHQNSRKNKHYRIFLSLVALIDSAGSATARRSRRLQPARTNFEQH